MTMLGQEARFLDVVLDYCRRCAPNFSLISFARRPHRDDDSDQTNDLPS